MRPWIGSIIFAAGCAASSASAPASTTSPPSESAGSVSVIEVENTCADKPEGIEQMVAFVVSTAWQLGTQAGETIFGTDLPGDESTDCPIDVRHRALIQPAGGGFHALVRIGPIARCSGDLLCSMVFEVTGSR